MKISDILDRIWKGPADNFSAMMTAVVAMYARTRRHLYPVRNVITIKGACGPAAKVVIASGMNGPGTRPNTNDVRS